ncbi:cysteine desulfurase [Syntrophotalea carbinolica DSM 2380]|uniref:cysteine desulfurase n=1 Tax=Syntrophotalea carbinolica (strain DSM 2380 / NBRC 103641 / GraBd1) TaxID=338963 RepID=Q3A3H5_SYNC1|nr:cysteine desulfurase family protein [Syntrophotalea carbinolica]ABA89082.1 cysteine desulfurase [Syntrophotalea carbinolica DSM 2380]
MSHEPIYLDCHATTPVDPRVLEDMLPYFTAQCGNPAMSEHRHGEVAHRAVEQARQTVAESLGCRSGREIVFTGGATEANNMALFGALGACSGKRHVIASAIEHASVLAPLARLENFGVEVTLLPVDSCGRIDPECLRRALRPETRLVSVMFANNEIGTLQPVADIGRICREAGILFHCDAAQAVGHEPLDVEQLHIDLLSFCAHKFYGPKGIGGLYIRDTVATAHWQPILYGGGQEQGLRPGTLNVPAIVGMASALRLCMTEMDENQRNLREASGELFARLQRAFPQLRMNGDAEHKLARNLSITIPGIEASALMLLLKDTLSFSAGSACSSSDTKPSHVLRAIGLSDEECFQTIRLGLRPGVAIDKIARLLQRGIAAAPSFID